MFSEIDEITEYFSEEQYEEMLNDNEEEIIILGVPYQYGTTARKIDYHNFRENYLNYLDNMNLEEE